MEEHSDLIDQKKAEIEKYIDEQFYEANEKYEKYRKLGQIGPAEIRQFKENTYADYKQMLVSQGRVLNQIKPVTVINTPEKKEFFFAHVKD